MSNLKIYCEEYDFSVLESSFGGEVESDCGLSAEIVFVADEEIKRLNRELRSVDAVTDVLSFPSLDGIKGRFLKKEEYPAETDENGNLFLGSVAICAQRAREQAEEYGHSYERELFYLAAHGLFHLLGYDHMTEEDKREMRVREERVLGKSGLKRDIG